MKEIIYKPYIKDPAERYKLDLNNKIFKELKKRSVPADVKVKKYNNLFNKLHRQTDKVQPVVKNLKEDLEKIITEKIKDSSKELKELINSSIQKNFEDLSSKINTTIKLDETVLENFISNKLDNTISNLKIDESTKLKDLIDTSIQKNLEDLSSKIQTNNTLDETNLQNLISNKLDETFSNLKLELDKTFDDKYNVLEGKILSNENKLTQKLNESFIKNFDKLKNTFVPTDYLNNSLGNIKEDLNLKLKNLKSQISNISVRRPSTAFVENRRKHNKETAQQRLRALDEIRDELENEATPMDQSLSELSINQPNFQPDINQVNLNWASRNLVS